MTCRARMRSRNPGSESLDLRLDALDVPRLLAHPPRCLLPARAGRLGVPADRRAGGVGGKSADVVPVRNSRPQTWLVFGSGGRSSSDCVVPGTTRTGQRV